MLNPTGLNFYPKSTSGLRNHANWDIPATDFNCVTRNTDLSTVGAYEYTTATNPGWIPAKTIKTCVTGQSGGAPAAINELTEVSEGTKVVVGSLMLLLALLFV